MASRWQSQDLTLKSNSLDWHCTMLLTDLRFQYLSSSLPSYSPFLPGWESSDSLLKVQPKPGSGARGDFSKRSPSLMLCRSTILCYWLPSPPWPYVSVWGPGSFLVLCIPKLSIGVCSWTLACNLWTEDSDIPVSSGHCTEPFLASTRLPLLFPVTSFFKKNTYRLIDWFGCAGS